MIIQVPKGYKPDERFVDPRTTKEFTNKEFTRIMNDIETKLQDIKDWQGAREIQNGDFDVKAMKKIQKEKLGAIKRDLVELWEVL